MKQLSIFVFLCLLVSGCKGTGKSSSNNDVQEGAVLQQTIEQHWNGTYSLSVNYGDLDEFSSMAKYYSFKVNEKESSIIAEGYKTSFECECTLKEETDKLFLLYKRTIESSTGVPMKNEGDTIGVILFEQGKYYIQSPIIADTTWNYNTKLLLKKEVPDCSLTTDMPNQGENTDEQESFMFFITNYATNEDFQKQRTLFPLECIQTDSKGSTIVSQTDKTEYVYDSSFLIRGLYDVAFYHINLGSTPSDIADKGKENNDMILTQWGLTGYQKIYYFSKREGNWYLAKTKEETKDISSEEEGNSIPERFENFIVRFNNDPQFQTERIMFPLHSIYHDSDEKVIVDIDKQKYKPQTILVGKISEKISLFYINPGKEIDIDFIKDNSNNHMVVSVWGLTDYYNVYYFERLNGKWILKSVESNDPVEPEDNE